jgi:hypothetical protein
MLAPCIVRSAGRWKPHVGCDDPLIHVSAVHRHNTERLPGARVHKVIRRVSGELVPRGAGLRTGPRGLPEPTRQVVREMRGDGSTSTSRGRAATSSSRDRRRPSPVGLNVTMDNLRQNDLTLNGESVPRIDVIGFRLELDRSMEQVARGLSHPAASGRLDVSARR